MEHELRYSQANIAASQSGFTLIELIATIVIISVLAAVLSPRYIDAETSAKMRGLEMGVAELNGRETLMWALVAEWAIKRTSRLDPVQD
jgi:prepilin-type N-terminal cleavage/methylation domain-containing protein